MLDYARNDSHYLIPLYLIFIKLLNPFAFSLEKEKWDLITQNQKNLIFNDELVLHGRRSFMGTRHYIKAGINIPEISLVNTEDFYIENKT